MNITKVKMMTLGLVCALSVSSVVPTAAATAGSAKLKAPVIEKSLKKSDTGATSGITAKISESLRKSKKGKVVKKTKVKTDVVKASMDDAAVEFECVKGVGYVTANTLNVRDEPSKNGQIVDKLTFNTKVEYYTTEFADWVTIADDRYVNIAYLAEEPCTYKTIKAVKNWRKSFESHTVFGKSTRQQKLQNMANTDEKGFRVVDGRYCIAVGSAIGKKVGTCIDIILKNGTVIPCVMGDQKDNGDTDASNQRTSNGCVSEFIVEVKSLCRNSSMAATQGDVSYAFEEWNSPVVTFRVYDKNVLD